MKLEFPRARGAVVGDDAIVEVSSDGSDDDADMDAPPTYSSMLDHMVQTRKKAIQDNVASMHLDAVGERRSDREDQCLQAEEEADIRAMPSLRGQDRLQDERDAH